MKLEIPDPDQEPSPDSTALSMELTIGLALSTMVMLFGWVFWVDPGDAGDEIDSYEQFIEQRSAERQAQRPDYFAGEDEADWEGREDDLAAVFEYGPRPAAEAACNHFADAIEDDALPRDSRRVLRRGVNRVAGEIPWSCLTRLYLQDRLVDGSELAHEFERFWQQVDRMESHGALMATVVEDLGEQTLPDSQKFDRWLRRCAINTDYGATSQCRQLIREHRPEFGDDLLALTLNHLESEQRSQRDFELVADLLGYLARYGQPGEWIIEETEALPDYDIDLRLASVYQLCRLMNAPDEEVQTHAAAALGYIAEVAARPHNPHMHYRWRTTCRFAFGDPEEPQQYVPALGVAMIDDDETTVDYGLQTLIDRQLCERRDGYPDWYCGARRWTGGADSIRSVLGNYFARTGYVEWYELDELAEVMPQE